MRQGYANRKVVGALKNFKDADPNTNFSKINCGSQIMAAPATGLVEGKFEKGEYIPDTDPKQPTVLAILDYVCKPRM